MRLRQLEAEFVRWEERDGRVYLPSASTLVEAHGVLFLCPLCWQRIGQREGVHSVICWFVGKVPDHAEPKPGRWNPSGTGLDDLTFVGPGAASVLLQGGCGWHGFVRAGDAA